MKKRNSMILYVILIMFLIALAFAYIRPAEPPLEKQETRLLPSNMLQIKVRKGYSLSQISHDLGADWRKVAELNNLEDPNLILPGQKINIIPFNGTNVVRVSWYGPGFHGKTMANGKVYNMNDAKIAAHKWLPFNTRIRLTRVDNNKSVTRKIIRY